MWYIIGKKGLLLFSKCCFHVKSKQKEVVSKGKCFIKKSKTVRRSKQYGGNAGACTGFSPGGAKIQDKKFLRARSARDFFSPPLSIFRPPLRGGGDKFSPPPERGATKSQGGGRKKIDYLESKQT